MGIVNLHRQEFAEATPPVAPSPQPVDQSAIVWRHEQEALRGLNVFHRSARTLARRQAADAAGREIEEETARRQAEQADLQRQLDEQWRRLMANDPDVVFARLTEAFEDNEAPAAVAGVHDGEASVVVMVPETDAVPERMPTLTVAGNLSLRKLTKTEGNSFYSAMVCGHVLVTVREALAVAPGLKSVRVAVVRRTPPNAYGVQSVECLLAALFTRAALQGIKWQSADAGMIVNDASAELHVRQGATEELRPLDLSNEPSLAALLRAVDLDDLGAGAGETGLDEASGSADGGPAPSSKTNADTPPPWRPRPGWGTVRDYATVTNDHGGTDIACKFVPDDGSQPVRLVARDTVMPEMDEYARGIMTGPGNLTIRVPAAGMIDAEENVFNEINKMELAQRARMYAQGYDLYEDCGWAWTPDYKLVKAAPGLID